MSHIVFFFFFSSRRRHTRLTCDWSSDVCSSDLTGGANLANYDSTIECKNGATVVLGNTTTQRTSLANVPVGAGDAVVCTITNTRKTGTIELKKVIVGDSGSDSFKIAVTGVDSLDNIIKTSAVKTTGTDTVNTGSYDVGEVAGTTGGAILANYDSTIEFKTCPTLGSANPTTQRTSLANVPVGAGDAVVCTVTNTRK